LSYVHSWEDARAGSWTRRSRKRSVAKKQRNNGMNMFTIDTEHRHTSFAQKDSILANITSLAKLWSQ